MPSMRRRAGALVIVAALGLAACGGSDGEETAAPAVPDPPPAEPEAEPEELRDAAEADQYWSSERLAALESAKKSYVAPTPAPPAETTGGDAGSGADAPVAVEPTATEPVTVATGEALPSQAQRYRISGYVDVPDHIWLREYSDDEPEDGEKCRREQEGYEDVEPGTRLEVTDGDGNALAAGKLEKGELATSYEDKVGRAMDCRLPFTIEDVPLAESYTIVLEDRGDLTYSFQDLERQGWKVAFSIDW